MPISQELLDILACPKCKGDLVLTPEQDGLACERDGLVYPIRDEIPVMIIEQAISLEDWEKGERGNKEQ